MSVQKQNMEKSVWTPEYLNVFRLYKKNEYFIALFKATLPAGTSVLDPAQLKSMSSAISSYNQVFASLMELELSYSLAFEKEGKESIVSVGSQIIKEWKVLKNAGDPKFAQIKDWWPDLFETEERYLEWLKDVYEECAREQEERILKQDQL